MNKNTNKEWRRYIPMAQEYAKEYGITEKTAMKQMNNSGELLYKKRYIIALYDYTDEWLVAECDNLYELAAFLGKDRIRSNGNISSTLSHSRDGRRCLIGKDGKKYVAHIIDMEDGEQ